MKKKQKKAPQTLSPENYIRQRARSLPIYKCLINEDWEDLGMVTTTIARRHVNGNITFCSYLVDLQCLGVKETLYSFNEPEDVFDDYLDKLNASLHVVECDYSLLHNIVYAGWEYAEEIGFEPHKDFLFVTRYMLEEDSDDIPLIEITCGGENGKPLFVQGPFEDDAMAKTIIRKLEKSVGPNNFDYILGGNVPPFDDDEDEDWDDEDDDDWDDEDDDDWDDEDDDDWDDEDDDDWDDEDDDDWDDEDDDDWDDEDDEDWDDFHDEYIDNSYEKNVALYLALTQYLEEADPDNVVFGEEWDDEDQDNDPLDEEWDDENPENDLFDEEWDDEDPENDLFDEEWDDENPDSAENIKRMVALADILYDKIADFRDVNEWLAKWMKEARDYTITNAAYYRMLGLQDEEAVTHEDLSYLTEEEDGTKIREFVYEKWGDLPYITFLALQDADDQEEKKEEIVRALRQYPDHALLRLEEKTIKIQAQKLKKKELSFKALFGDRKEITPYEYVKWQVVLLHYFMSTGDLSGIESLYQFNEPENYIGRHHQVSMFFSVLGAARITMLRMFLLQGIREKGRSEHND